MDNPIVPWGTQSAWSGNDEGGEVSIKNPPARGRLLFGTGCEASHIWVLAKSFEDAK